MMSQLNKIHQKKKKIKKKFRAKLYILVVQKSWEVAIQRIKELDYLRESFFFFGQMSFFSFFE